MQDSANSENNDLGRFLKAQEKVYAAALEELRAGRKETHWMWFIFPQVAGLGKSETAAYYAIADRAEATEYLDHPILGQRLRECTEAVLAQADRTVQQIFGFPDDMKFHSCMTLFEEVDEAGGIFRKVLDKHFNGSLDLETIKHLK